MPAGNSRRMPLHAQESRRAEKLTARALHRKPRLDCLRNKGPCGRLRRTLGQRSVAGSCRFPFDAYSSRSTMKRTCWPIATCASVCFFI